VPGADVTPRPGRTISPGAGGRRTVAPTAANRPSARGRL